MNSILLNLENVKPGIEAPSHFNKLAELIVVVKAVCIGSIEKLPKAFYVSTSSRDFWIILFVSLSELWIPRFCKGAAMMATPSTGYTFLMIIGQLGKGELVREKNKTK